MQMRLIPGLTYHAGNFIRYTPKLIFPMPCIVHKKPMFIEKHLLYKLKCFEACVKVSSPNYKKYMFY